MKDQYVQRSFSDPSFDMTGKTILITGGTGSFGKAFLAHILSNYAPQRIIIFSRDEFKQHQMAIDFPATDYPCLRFFIGVSSPACELLYDNRASFRTRASRALTASRAAPSDPPRVSTRLDPSRLDSIRCRVRCRSRRRV